jgi:putative oxidoreductase
MSISERISPLLGRLILAWFFLSEALWRLQSWDATIKTMQDQHLPGAALMLALAAAVMVFGAVSLAFGYQTRVGALLLFALTVVTTTLMNAYWQIDNPVLRGAAYDLFIRNMGIAGGLLFLVGMGPGPFAFDDE